MMAGRISADEAYRLLTAGLHPTVVALYSGLPMAELRKRFRLLHGASAGPIPQRDDVLRRCWWESHVFLRDYPRVADAGAEEIDLPAVELVYGAVAVAGGQLTLTDAWLLARDLRSGVIKRDGHESTEVRLCS